MYECCWCLKLLKENEIKCCKRDACNLKILCENCNILHQENHLAKENPVLLLLNNMINLPQNKTLIVGKYF